MARATHFEIQAEDPKRAILFYEEVFGWKFTKWEASPVPYWFIETGDDETPGINGGLLQRNGPAPMAGNPVNAYTMSMEVENIEETETRVANGGGAIVVERKEIPGQGWQFYATDTEGNIFGVHQPLEKN